MAKVKSKKKSSKPGECPSCLSRHVDSKYCGSCGYEFKNPQSHDALPPIRFKPTNRGFNRAEFQDNDGIKCSLQESSLATEAAIWFGCNDADPKALIPGRGWTNVEMPKDYVANTRMHLTQAQVKNLLPYLQEFVKTGYLGRAGK